MYCSFVSNYTINIARHLTFVKKKVQDKNLTLQALNNSFEFI